jgi:DNA-binding NarL/FixJ family response regulator
VIAAGEALLAPRITGRLIAQVTAAPSAERIAEERLAVLTSREREVLALVGRGMSNEEIGAELFLSPGTARTHVGHALRKLDAGHVHDAEGRTKPLPGAHVSDVMGDGLNPFHAA